MAGSPRWKPFANLGHRKTGSESSSGRDYRKRFRALVLQRILYRIGWAFKTESLIIPRFVSLYTASNTIVALLPFISRVGRLLPQIPIARVVERLPRLKGPFAGFIIISALCFGSVGVLLAVRPTIPGSVILPLFFSMYALFWLLRAVIMLLDSSLRGRLIPAEQRGRLLGTSALTGGFGAVAAMGVIHWIYRRGDIFPPPAGYALFFCVACGIFLLSAMPVLKHLHEPPNPPIPPRVRWGAYLARIRDQLRTNRDFRLFFILSLLLDTFQSGMFVYLVYGKRVIGFPDRFIGLFLLAQSACTMGGSVILGAVADRWGNRRVLRILSCLAVAAPLYAIMLGSIPKAWASRAFILVYMMIGFSVPRMELAANYLLEISAAKERTTLIGAINTLSTPIAFFSILLGMIADRISYTAAFVVLALAGAAALILSLRIREPRYLLAVEGGDALDAGIKKDA